MSDSYRVSGKRVALPKVERGRWTLSLRPGGWVLALGPQGERARLMISESRDRLSASLGGTLWNGQLVHERGRGQTAGGGALDLVAQFPGKVRKVLAQEGAIVTEGEPLVLVEAMKMEFAIKAPYAGKVTRLNVSEGKQLSPGDTLLDIEALPEGAGNG